jgi:hypothetical protein
MLLQVLGCLPSIDQIQRGLQQHTVEHEKKTQRWRQVVTIVIIMVIVAKAKG